MNIIDNSIDSLQKYVKRKLEDKFEKREIDVISSQLFEHFLQMDRGDVVMNKMERVTEAQILLFHDAIDELRNNKPLQYIFGETEFYGLKIQVTPDVLIPRPETEELVDWMVELNTIPNPTILDIGTGSGCIPLALKSKIKNAQVWGVDISSAAINVAKKNATSLNIEVSFEEMDILKENINLPSLDMVVSNPPYIPIKEKSLMKKNVLDYEPDIALFVSDEDPLIFYRIIAKQAYEKLTNHGMLFFEINEKYGKEVVSLMNEIGFVEIEIKKDLQGKERMIKGEKK